MNTPKPMPGSAVVLATLAILAWVLLMLVLPTVVGNHAMGDSDIFLGLRWLFAGVLVVGVWLCTSGLLFVAGGRDLLPAWVRAVALVVWPASGIAAVTALYLVDATDARWPLIVPVAIPPLLAVYGAALFVPSRRPVFLRPGVHAVTWGAVFLLAFPIAPVAIRHMNETARKESARDREDAAREAREKEIKRSQYLEKIGTISPDAPITDWYDVLAQENGVRPEAIQAYRKVERRQRDVEYLLNNGIPMAMKLAPDVDLNPTPRLCEAAKTCLAIMAKNMHVKNTDPYPYQGDPGLDDSLPGIRWFLTHSCDCSAGVAAIDAVIRKDYLDSPQRQKILGDLAGLRTSH